MKKDVHLGHWTFLVGHWILKETIPGTAYYILPWPVFLGRPGLPGQRPIHHQGQPAKKQLYGIPGVPREKRTQYPMSNKESPMKKDVHLGHWRFLVGHWILKEKIPGTPYCCLSRPIFLGRSGLPGQRPIHHQSQPAKKQPYGIPGVPREKRTQYPMSNKESPMKKDVHLGHWTFLVGHWILKEKIPGTAYYILPWPIFLGRSGLPGQRPIHHQGQPAKKQPYGIPGFSGFPSPLGSATVVFVSS